MLKISEEKLTINVKDVNSVKMLDGIYRKTLSYNKDVMLCHFLLEKDISLPLHNHEANQAGYVLRGKIRFEVEIDDIMVEFVANQGDTYIFDSKQRHGAYILDEAEVMEAFSPYRENYI